MALPLAPPRAAPARSAQRVAACAAEGVAARAAPRSATRRAASCCGGCCARPAPLRAAALPRCRQPRRACSSADDAASALEEPEAAEAADESAGEPQTASDAPAAPSARDLRLARCRWDLARVACAPSAEAVLQLSADTLTLTPSCAAAVLSRLARLLCSPRAGGDADAAEVTEDARFKHLLAVTERQMRAMRSPRTLFITFFAVCTLYGHSPGRSQPPAAGWRLPPRSFVARAVAVAGVRGMQPALLPKELVFVLQMCARVRAPVSATWLAPMWSARGGTDWASLELFSQGDLFWLHRALRSLQVVPPAEWQEALWRSPAARAWDPNAKTTAFYLAAAEPVLRPPPQDWLDVLWAESAAPAAEMRPGSAAQLMMACSRLEVKPPEAWMRYFWATCAHELSSGEMKFEQLPKLLLVASLIDLKPPEAFTSAMFDAAVEGGDEMSEQDVETLLTAVRRMGLEPPKGWELKLLIRGGGGAHSAR